MRSKKVEIIDDEVASASSMMMGQTKIIHKNGIYRKVNNKTKKGGAFRDEIRKLMFGFGDDPNPDEKSVDVMEGYFEEIILNLVTQSSRRSQRHGSNQLRLADVLHTIRKDDKKFLRMPYIITAYRDIEKTTNDVSHLNKFADDKVRKNLKFN